MRLYCFSFRSIPGYALLSREEQHGIVRLAHRRLCQNGTLPLLWALVAAANAVASLIAVRLLGAGGVAVLATASAGAAIGALAAEQELGVKVEAILVAERCASPSSSPS